MRLRTKNDRQRFTLADLGVLNDARDRVFDALVNLAATSLSAPKAAILVVDEEAGSVFARSSTGLALSGAGAVGVALETSITRVAREEDRVVIGTPDCVFRSELDRFGAGAFLGAPFHDPAGEPIGVLAVADDVRRTWRDAEIAMLEELAHILSQQVLLRASLYTLKILSPQSVSLPGQNRSVMN